MRRKKSSGARHTKASPASAKPGRSRVKVLLAIALMLGGVWLWRMQNTPRVPAVNLANLDPAVSRLIQQALEDARARPRSASAWGNLGMLLSAYHLTDPARECLAGAERLDGRDARWPYFQSLLLFEVAPDAALVKLQRAVELCGNDPEAPRLRLASFLAEAGKWEEAEKEIQELLRAKRDFAPALLLSARAAQARGKIPEAISLAKRCSDDPRTARSSALFLANLYVRAGNTSEAAALTRRAATLPPDEIGADPFQAEAALLRNDPRFLCEQAHRLLAARRLKEVGPLITRLVNEHADYPETWLLAGRFKFLTKDFMEAETFLRRHLELDRTSSQGWFQLGLVQLSLEQLTNATETFSKAIQLKADFGAAFYNQGLALARAGKFSGALPAFHEAIRLNPERIDSYLMGADVALRMKQKEQAMKLLQQAEALNPAHPGLQQLREKAGQWKMEDGRWKKD